MDTKIPAEKLLDLGNYGMVALVLSQVTTQAKDPTAIIVGAIFTVATWATGLWLLGRERRVKHVV
jgi:lipopolysaccharide export LptBFGC system permease protein LptF